MSKKVNATAPQIDFAAGVASDDSQSNEGAERKAEDVPTDPVEPLPGNTQDPPPLDPNLGASSPPSPAGDDSDNPDADPKPDNLGNTNVLQGGMG
jgi:hypothetical protein